MASSRCVRRLTPIASVASTSRPSHRTGRYRAGGRQIGAVVTDTVAASWPGTLAAASTDGHHEAELVPTSTGDLRPDPSHPGASGDGQDPQMTWREQLGPSCCAPGSRRPMRYQLIRCYLSGSCYRVCHVDQRPARRDHSGLQAQAADVPGGPLGEHPTWSVGPAQAPAATLMPCSIARLASSSAATSAPPMRCTRSRPAATQLVVQAAHRLLAGADHDVVDLEQPRLAVDGEVQAGVVDPVVRRAADLLDAGLLEHRPVRPARGLAEVLADHRGLALDEVDLARRRSRGSARSSPPRVQRSGRRRPSAPATPRASPRSWVRKHRDVDADAAGADDRDPLARRRRAPLSTSA